MKVKGIITSIISAITPPNKWRVSVILLAGTIFGIGSYIFYVSRAWSYLSDDPSTCVNCHIMKTEYATWRHSSHYRVANCNDCHVPHNNVFRKYYFKATDGMRHSAIFTARTYAQSIRMREPGRQVVLENCIRCHGNLTEMVKANVNYSATLNGDGRVCWDCHREVPHGTRKSLSSTPGGEVPVPQSPVPEWLQKLTNSKFK
jgi:cytochrome c nitrite reductase small subunit